MSVRITAVVCTHNRATYLRKALKSLVNQTLSRELYEIIVVDNCSQDNTKEVVDEFSDVSNLCYLYEPIIGLSRARNTAWRNAHGDYVAYLDDDAVACPSWLEKIIEVFETFTPSPGSVGGKVEPIWEAQKPNWLSDKLLGCLGIVDFSDVPKIVGEDQWLAGCNIAFPRDLIREVAGFREDLGRHGTTLRSNEESYLRQQLSSLGYCSVYHPEIVVGHHISPSRLTKSYFRKITYWLGLSDALMMRLDDNLFLSKRIWLSLMKFLWLLPRLCLMLISPNSPARFRRQCQLFEAMGYVAGVWRRGTEGIP